MPNASLARSSYDDTLTDVLRILVSCIHGQWVVAKNPVTVTPLQALETLWVMNDDDVITIQVRCDKAIMITSFLKWNHSNEW